jgi:uncharacterized protein YndB with AHSA1/START domain
MTATTQIGETTYATPTPLEIEVVHVVRAPRDLVFAALTEPEHLKKWLLGPEGWTMTVCDVDLRAGGGTHYEWRNDDGRDMQISSSFVEVDPPARIVSTESWGGDWPETQNTVTLTEADGVTTMTTLVRYPTREARDAAIATGMREGMSLSFKRLSRLLEG